MENRYKQLKERLMDEESVCIFDARLEYMNTKDGFRFGKAMLELYGEFQYLELDNFLSGRERNPVLVIFGAGKEGERTLDILKHTKYKRDIYGFCDNNKKLTEEATTRYGLPVYSVYDLLTQEKDVVFLIASQRYSMAFLTQLLNLKVPQKNIFVAPYHILFAQRGKQYFDLFEPAEHEVFVDAGAYDGSTSRDFLKWCHGVYDGIYMFELNSYMKQLCFHNLGNTDHKIHFIEKGCWSEDTTLTFVDSQSSSHILGDVEGGEDSVFAAVCSLDSELKDVVPTFIKMDIEGAEMEALKGARGIIENTRPRLAISVYHKPEDMVDIMDYILRINPDYKLYLRHYSSCCWETVLYAL